MVVGTCQRHVLKGPRNVDDLLRKQNVILSLTKRQIKNDYSDFTDFYPFRGRAFPLGLGQGRTGIKGLSSLLLSLFQSPESLR